MSIAVRVIRPQELDRNLRARWRQIQLSNADLASPHFCVEFTEAVAAVRNDLYIGIIEDGSGVVGFFPYHRRPCGFARPVGLGLSDYHGVIIESTAQWTSDDLLRGCGLVRWKFDHQLVSQPQMLRGDAVIENSPILDVSSGFAAYERQRVHMGGSQLRTIHRRIRKLARDYEPHRFVEHDPDPERVNQVLALKSAQCREAGTYDYFSLAWTVALVRRLHAIQTPDFSGALSCVYVGDRCVAAHLGLRSQSVWHWWFPCYEKAFRRYSPGLILLWELARAAADRRMRYVDLGKGTSAYKTSMMTCAVQVAEGEITRPSVWNRAAAAIRGIQDMRRHRLLRPILWLPAGVMRRAVRALRYY